MFALLRHCRTRLLCRLAAGAGVALALAHAPAAWAQQTYDSPGDSSSPVQDAKQHVLELLPPAVSDGLDIDGWAWFSYLHNSRPKSDFTDTVFSLNVTKSFAQHAALTFEGNVIDADGQWRGEVEQLYLSLRPFDDSPAFVTVGKFNANFGLEQRDFWDRTHGTTGLLFAAQPQDLVGLIGTLPVGSTGLTLRPFVGLDFQGQFEYNQPPLAGLQLQYKPARELSLSWTNFWGPGVVTYDGRPIRHPFPQGGYGGTASALENWQGPNLIAQRNGMLFFSDANVLWRPRRDLSLGAEGLVGTTDTDEGRVGWWGAMFTTDFDITDKLWIFGRYSYLDDSDWLIYGNYQRLYECSAGAGYRLYDKVEIRGEYRHDHGSVTGNSDSVSIHITAGF